MLAFVCPLYCLDVAIGLWKHGAEVVLVGSWPLVSVLPVAAISLKIRFTQLTQSHFARHNLKYYVADVADGKPGAVML